MAARASAEVLGQFASPYFVLGRQQRSTYTHVRLALLALSGLVWLATWPSTWLRRAGENPLAGRGDRAKLDSWPRIGRRRRIPCDGPRLPSTACSPSSPC